MKLIKPAQVSSHIMTLIDEAVEKMIIVSPYYKIDYWYKLHEYFKRLFARNIDVQFYVREGEVRSIEELKAWGIIPNSIPKLHCKLYMNEKEGIVATMNLTQSSDISSLDIGYMTENEEEYKELNNFYIRYIQPHQNGNHNNEIGEKLNFYDQIEDELSKQHTNYRIRSRNKGSFVRYEIGSRTFDLEFKSQKGGELLIIRSILPAAIYDFLKTKELELQKSIDCEMCINDSFNGSYSTLICQFKLLPKDINYYSNQDIHDLVERVKKVSKSFFELIEGSGDSNLIRYL